MPIPKKERQKFLLKMKKPGSPFILLLYNFPFPALLCPPMPKVRWGNWRESSSCQSQANSAELVARVPKGHFFGSYTRLSLSLSLFLSLSPTHTLYLRLFSVSGRRVKKIMIALSLSLWEQGNGGEGGERGKIGKRREEREGGSFFVGDEIFTTAAAILLVCTVRRGYTVVAKVR